MASGPIFLIKLVDFPRSPVSGYGDETARFSGKICKAAQGSVAQPLIQVFIVGFHVVP